MMTVHPVGRCVSVKWPTRIPGTSVRPLPRASGACCAGAVVATLVRPVAWVLGLVGFLAGGGLAIVAWPIVVLPTPTGAGGALREDETVRAGTTAERLSTLAPAFRTDELAARSAPQSVEEEPELRPVGPDHLVACHLVGPGGAAPEVLDLAAGGI